MFKLWSETNREITEQLKPNLGVRSWNALGLEEKQKIWKYLEEYFFNKDKKIYKISEDPYRNPNYDYYFSNIFGNNIQTIVRSSIYSLNQSYKTHSFGETFLNDNTLLNACNDFYNILINGDENLVLELLSFYSKFLIKLSFDYNRYLSQNEDESDDVYHIRFLNYQYNYFDIFAERLNEVFNDFGLNITLTRQGFIPKQGEKIVEEIFKPTLDFLSDGKYKEVNRDLGDAFSDYHKKDYSGTITKTISAIQAFLQISVRGNVGKGDIAELINESINGGLIPNDIFTTTIFGNIKSIIMRERQETADAHPKKNYANEQNARLILNLSMVFMQHFIQIEK